MRVQNKNYLGDGVYVSYDGFHVVLQTSDEIAIFLEPDVLQNLLMYVERNNYGKEEN